jgi:hypothetical protein
MLALRCGSSSAATFSKVKRRAANSQRSATRARRPGSPASFESAFTASPGSVEKRG